MNLQDLVDFVESAESALLTISLNEFKTRHKDRARPAGQLMATLSVVTRAESWSVCWEGLMGPLASRHTPYDTPAVTPLQG